METTGEDIADFKESKISSVSVLIHTAKQGPLYICTRISAALRIERHGGETVQAE